MTQTRVVYELDEQSEANDRIIEGMEASFRQYCRQLTCSVVPRYEFPETRSVAEALVLVTRLAYDEIVSHPDCELCIYLAPRLMRVCDQPVTSTIFAIRNRARVLAARVQVVIEEDLRSQVQDALVAPIASAHTQIFVGGRPAIVDEPLAQSVEHAIIGGYINGHELLFGARNVPKQ